MLNLKEINLGQFEIGKNYLLQCFDPMCGIYFRTALYEGYGLFEGQCERDKIQHHSLGKIVGFNDLCELVYELPKKDY